MKILLANPRGFCAGVDRAIEIVERALELFGAPIFVRHEVVHNRFVVDGLRQRGAVFVDQLEEVPNGATVIFSAHGVSQKVRAEAAQRGLNIFDATCPLVTKVHMEVVRQCKAGRNVVLIGHAGHPEVEGTLGQWNDSDAKGNIFLVETSQDVAQLEINNSDNIAYVTQTTLSVDDTQVVIDALRKRFPHLIGPRHDDICYATQNRQDAIKRLGQECDLVLIVGSPNSSNSNRLRELAEKQGVPAYLIDGACQIDPVWLKGCEHIGVSAGASAPESLVQEVVVHLQKYARAEVHELEGQSENVTFALPKELRIQIVS